MKSDMAKNGITFVSNCIEKPWVYLEGYPNFAFRYDGFKQKYAIAACELTKESSTFRILEGNKEVIERVFNRIENEEKKIKINSFTEPFIDEIIFSEAPLETWVSDYVVVRIGEFYYLADNNGNCYHKRDKPFIICRNVFVSADRKTIITYGNKEVTPTVDIVVKQFGDYNFAIASNTKGNAYTDHKPYESLLDINGKEIFIEEDCGRYNRKVYLSNLEEVHNWCLFYKDEAVFIDRTFNITERYFLHSGSEMTERLRRCLTGKKSKTYYFVTTCSIKYYSTYFNSQVAYDSIGNVEIIWYNRKTYFFKPNGKIEVINGEIMKYERSGKYFVYLIDNIVVMSDLNGEKVSEEELSPAKLLELLHK